MRYLAPLLFALACVQGVPAADIGAKIPMPADPFTTAQARPAKAVSRCTCGQFCPCHAEVSCGCSNSNRAPTRSAANVRREGDYILDTIAETGPIILGPTPITIDLNPPRPTTQYAAPIYAPPLSFAPAPLMGFGSGMRCGPGG